MLKPWWFLLVGRHLTGALQLCTEALQDAPWVSAPQLMLSLPTHPWLLHPLDMGKGSPRAFWWCF